MTDPQICPVLGGCPRNVLAVGPIKRWRNVVRQDLGIGMTSGTRDWKNLCALGLESHVAYAQAPQRSKVELKVECSCAHGSF